MSMLNQPFSLPCGDKLSNRMVKAALTERLASSNHLPNEKHCKLYETWAKGGASVLLSGNILVDERYLEAAGNVVGNPSYPKEPFKKWTETVTKTNTHFWAQLNHAGRQASIFSTSEPISASAVQLKKIGLFAKPRPMTEADITDVIQRFVQAAIFCQKVGFTGVQIHAAHGYLFSQFLSPKTNLRTDQWGGSIENRARLLFKVLEQLRTAVGKSFPISVKLNSADFQRGGFDEKDALFVVKELEKRGVDLLEISGGTYEDVTFFTQKGLKQSTKEREAYFLDFAKKVRKESQLPIMVTGGFRTLAFCNKVLENKELDVVGFGRPFLLHDDFAQGFLDSSLEKIVDPVITSPIKSFWDSAVAGFYDYQIERIATGKKIDLSYTGRQGAWRMTKNEMWKGFKNRMAARKG